MSDTYIPPFTMTDEITNLVIEIAELTGAMTVSEQLSKNPKLRRDNRIKSIHSSLAIEQNTLTEEQVSDVIDGRLGKGIWRIQKQRRRSLCRRSVDTCRNTC